MNFVEMTGPDRKETEEGGCPIKSSANIGLRCKHGGTEKNATQHVSRCLQTFFHQVRKKSSFCHFFQMIFVFYRDPPHCNFADNLFSSGVSLPPPPTPLPHHLSIQPCGQNKLVWHCTLTCKCNVNLPSCNNSNTGTVHHKLVCTSIFFALG